VSSASTELELAANTLTKTAETTQQLSTVVASASEESSTNVQSVASATEEMTGSVGEISRQVQESSNIAGEAVKQAQETDKRITELSHATSRIGDVVKLITAVAEQTNLLAVNATTEAARRGGRARLRAVVASEVKALAAQTAKATSDISTQIAGMQTATQDSVTPIKEIGGYDPAHFGDRGDHRRGGRGAGRGDAGNLPQRAGGRQGHSTSCDQHRQPQPRSERDRLGLIASAVVRAVAGEREQPPQDRGREIP
jgi:hypothetical protein